MPPRHQGFVAVVLGQAYKKAHQAATRFAAQRVIRKASEQNYFYDDASHGVAFVTTPKGDQTYLLGSVLPEADQRFDDDADLLRQAITNTQGAASQDLLRRFKIAIAAPNIRLV